MLRKFLKLLGVSKIKNYVEINRKLWNTKTDIHYESDFYDNKSFISGRNSLNKIELDLLGDVRGKKILHLQCHFGQDTISLSRMGATTVGIDLSDKSIDKARNLAKKLDADARFICCNIYDVEKYLDDKFDIVFTSYGTIGWLPDIDKWAQLIYSYLLPGGQFIFVDFHPFIWMFDDNFQNVVYRYFQSEPIIEEVEGTYTDRDANIREKSVGWNHALSEVISSLIKTRLVIKDFKEYDYSPYNCFANMVDNGEQQFRIENFGDKIPLVYSILAIKA